MGLSYTISFALAGEMPSHLLFAKENPLATLLQQDKRRAESQTNSD